MTMYRVVYWTHDEPYPHRWNDYPTNEQAQEAAAALFTVPDVSRVDVVQPKKKGNS